MLYILLRTGRKIIAIKCKNPQPPTVAQWKQELREVE